MLPVLNFAFLKCATQEKLLKNTASPSASFNWKASVTKHVEIPTKQLKICSFFREISSIKSFLNLETMLTSSLQAKKFCPVSVPSTLCTHSGETKVQLTSYTFQTSKMLQDSFVTLGLKG